jgi:hypothetical protein|uniref:Uncharacterized protein n=1 Tax=Siphoviridae sp. ctSP74 TaxID=2826343 RepID=A0A8S5NP91_9CAUD|nr:MAG TPA: hypothetical protein [Siphoviridae sp. ctSP74]
MTNEELEQEVKRLEEQITNLRIKLLESKADKKPYEVKVPDDIRNYYYADEIGEIYVVGNIISIDAYKEIYQRGITFETEREVKQYERECILLFKLHKWAEEHNEGWTPDWSNFNERKCYITCKKEQGEFDVNFCRTFRHFVKLPYFKSEEIAEQFIEEFGDEIKEVLC